MMERPTEAIKKVKDGMTARPQTVRILDALVAWIDHLERNPLAYIAPEKLEKWRAEMVEDLEAASSIKGLKQELESHLHGTGAPPKDVPIDFYGRDIRKEIGLIWRRIFEDYDRNERRRERLLEDFARFDKLINRVDERLDDRIDGLEETVRAIEQSLRPLFQTNNQFVDVHESIHEIEDRLRAVNEEQVAATDRMSVLGTRLGNMGKEHVWMMRRITELEQRDVIGGEKELLEGRIVELEGRTQIVEDTYASVAGFHARSEHLEGKIDEVERRTKVIEEATAGLGEANIRLDLLNGRLADYEQRLALLESICVGKDDRERGPVVERPLERGSLQEHGAGASEETDGD